MPSSACETARDVHGRIRHCGDDEQEACVDRHRQGRSVGAVFFFNDTATTEIYTLSLHDALPISSWRSPSAVDPTMSANSTVTTLRLCAVLAARAGAAATA